MVGFTFLLSRLKKFEKILNKNNKIGNIMQKNKSIVLLSGGLDSVVNLKMALDQTNIALTLTFDYGQAAAKKELEATTKISNHFNIPHRIIKLDFLDEISNALKKENIIDFDSSRIDDLSYTIKTAKSVWVPNRNGLFLNIAACFADSMNIDEIIVGFNKEEAKTFPDNSLNFIENANKSFEFSTLYHPKVNSFTINKIKTEIVKLGIEIDAPFKYIWSCYRNTTKMCGVCESCGRLKRALKQNNFYEKFIEINIWGFEK